MASRIQRLKKDNQPKIEPTVLVDQIGQGNCFIRSVSKSRPDKWRQGATKYSFSVQVFLSEIVFGYIKNYFPMWKVSINTLGFSIVLRSSMGGWKLTEFNL